MQETVILSFDKTLKTINISPNFKTFLNQLNELFPDLPETFVIYYNIPNQLRGIYIGCPEDYRVYLRKLGFREFGKNISPLLRILPRETEKVFNNNLDELEKSQCQEFQNHSDIIASLNSEENQSEIAQNPPSQISFQKKPSYEYLNYQKCQLCYQPLQDYYRCLTCFFFQLCEKCNKYLRYEHHPQTHMFILIRQNRVEFDDLKSQAIDMIQQQKWRLKFKIHQRQIHEQISCDKCDRGPITGKRYKCIDCPDFDLCQICFDSNEHKAEKHNFLQMDQSIEFVKI